MDDHGRFAYLVGLMSWRDTLRNQKHSHSEAVKLVDQDKKGAAESVKNPAKLMKWNAADHQANLTKITTDITDLGNQIEAAKAALEGSHEAFFLSDLQDYDVLKTLKRTGVWRGDRAFLVPDMKENKKREIEKSNRVGAGCFQLIRLPSAAPPADAPPADAPPADAPPADADPAPAPADTEAAAPAGGGSRGGSDWRN